MSILTNYFEKRKRAKKEAKEISRTFTTYTEKLFSNFEREIFSKYKNWTQAQPEHEKVLEKYENNGFVTSWFD